MSPRREALTILISLATAQAARAVHEGRPADAHRFLDLADRYLALLAA